MHVKCNISKQASNNQIKFMNIYETLYKRASNDKYYSVHRTQTRAAR